MLKRLYDLLSVYVLAAVLVLGVTSLGFQAIAEAAASFTGDGGTELLWKRVANALGMSSLGVRLAVFGSAQLGAVALLWRPLDWLWTTLEQGIERLDALAVRWPRGRVVLGRVFTVGVTLLLLPFLLQPTLVPLRFGANAWLQRTANLLDGHASSEALASGISVWRWAFPPPLHNRYAGGTSRMDRWDPLLRSSTRNPVHFAQTKAFLYVESGGRQFAVSRTGCLGLMQFCVSTARRAPFRQIFGVGSVSACDCGGRPCSVPRAIADALESDPDALELHRADLPCDPADARFDPDRAIPAGAAFTEELSDAVGGNLALMYVGYNSGPAVARRLWTVTGRDPDLTLTELRPHLAPTLARWYGDKAPGRARGLLDVHLPKLLGAYEDFLQAERAR